MKVKKFRPSELITSTRHGIQMYSHPLFTQNYSRSRTLENILFVTGTIAMMLWQYLIATLISYSKSHK